MGLKPCSRCKSALYCDRTCQTAHWKAGHKAMCSALHQDSPVAPASVTPALPSSASKHNEPTCESEDLNALPAFPSHKSLKSNKEEAAFHSATVDFVRAQTRAERAKAVESWPTGSRPESTLDAVVDCAGLMHNAATVLSEWRFDVVSAVKVCELMMMAASSNGARQIKIANASGGKVLSCMFSI